MPLNKEALPLPADPQSVRRARAWVGEVLERLGRDDLVEPAALGVSELVTNAILHAESPITVRVRGTRAHPRVEVRDNSQRPPAINTEMTDEEHLLSTIGRGLGLVALFSSTWGSEMAPDGKTVWFEPTNEPNEEAGLAGDVFDLDQEIEARLAAAERPDDLIRIQLLDMPVQLFAHFRQRYNELRRELRLLSLAHAGDYPVASELTEIFLQVEQERRQAEGVSQLDDAIERGLEKIDLEYLIPPTAPASMARMKDMLEQADQFCRDQRLLVLAASEQQLALQRWYFGEFRRQADGEAPIPWKGGFVVDESDRPHL